MSIVDQIGTYLAGQMPGTNISQGAMPPMPDRCVTVFGTDLNSSSTSGMRVQILVRGDSSPTMALDDAETVAELLDEFEGLLTADGNYINRIRIENGPAHIGADENSRQEYTINLRVWFCQ